LPPRLVDRKSMPARANCSPNQALSSTPLPPAMHSSARKRQPTAQPGPTSARTAAYTASGRRTRASRGPPQPSARWLVADRKEAIVYACA
jgi:hypothetical protein